MSVQRGEASRPVRFAVFDLDGTLIDSRRDLSDSANAMLAEYGAAPLSEEHIASMVGCGAATLVKRVISAAGVEASPSDALDRFLANYDRRLTHHTRPYEGIPATLDRLQSQAVMMAVLTNKPLEQSLKILTDFELSKYFRWTVGGDGPLPRKPSPDGLQHLIQQASASAGETVLVGDSIVDLQTARNAGVRICLARYGFGFADLPSDQLTGAELLVDTPAAIPAVLHGHS